MFSTFNPQEVTILLKDISGQVEPMDTLERERRIQAGTPYCEMLPVEYEPGPAYMQAYEWALRNYSCRVAFAAARAARGILERRGSRAVLVSLARAGTTAGILIHRYAKQFLGVSLPHYTISIIRGVGIDRNAMRAILRGHRPEDLQFVDGWTGKGAILRELERAVPAFPGVDPGLAVLADPAGIAAVSGTRQDLLIPGSCLNATVCGLLSRTFLRSDIIGPRDFHGAAFYGGLRGRDLTASYLDAISAQFPEPGAMSLEEAVPDADPAAEVAAIQQDFGIPDVNHIKPGIGEATRVLLRRVPWKVLVHSRTDYDSLGHLYRLAEEKNVELVEYPLKAYRACGLIRDLADA